MHKSASQVVSHSCCIGARGASLLQWGDECGLLLYLTAVSTLLLERVGEEGDRRRLKSENGNPEACAATSKDQFWSFKRDVVVILKAPGSLTKALTSRRAGNWWSETHRS
jgi:hypothetical protein